MSIIVNVMCACHLANNYNHNDNEILNLITYNYIEIMLITKLKCRIRIGIE